MILFCFKIKRQKNKKTKNFSRHCQIIQTHDKIQLALFVNHVGDT